MAQRLGKAFTRVTLTCREERCAEIITTTARRFQKQIFLSVDIPPGFPSLQQEAEKGIVAFLGKLE